MRPANPREHIAQLVAGRIAVLLSEMPLIDTQWALRAMPEQHGIVFDLGTEQMFQWNAQGLAKYKKDVLEWE